MNTNMNKTYVVVGVGEGLVLAIARRFHQENYQLALMSHSLDEKLFFST